MPYPFYLFAQNNEIGHCVSLHGGDIKLFFVDISQREEKNDLILTNFNC